MLTLLTINIITMLKRLLLLFTILSIISESALAINREYDDKKSFSIDSLLMNTELDLRLNYGFFIHHHQEMKVFQADFPMFELSLQKQTYGRQAWQSYFNYPTIGITAFYSNLGEIDVIGNAYALYPFISFPFNKSKVNTFGFRFGVGVGYLTEKYHPVKNYRNTSIGSHFNAAISMTFEYKRQISERFKLSAFAGLTHFSNGCSHDPNSGINIINAGLSTTYLLNKPEEYIPAPKADNRIYLNKFNPEFYLGMSFGIKRIEYNQKDDFMVYDLELYIMDRITNLSKVGIGIDIVSDATDDITLKKHYGLRDDYTFFELLKPGIGVAYELMMGDASFLFNFGYHPWGKEMRYGRWYQKLGLKVDFSEYVYAKIALNTHFGVADFIGFGVGVKL